MGAQFPGGPLPRLHGPVASHRAECAGSPRRLDVGRPQPRSGGVQPRPGGTRVRPQGAGPSDREIPDRWLCGFRGAGRPLVGAGLWRGAARHLRDAEAIGGSMSGPRRLKASDVPGLLRPGMRVFVQGGAGEPLLIQAALREAPEASAGVEYVAALTPGVNEFDYAALHSTTRMEGFFVAPPQRESFAAGKLRFLPINYCLIWEHLAASPPVDIAFLNLAPPDAQGRCSLGLSADFPSAVWPRAKIILAQINPGLPSVADDPGVPWDRLDAVIEAEGPPIVQDVGAPDATMQAIA